jgi:hypothetical protein
MNQQQRAAVQQALDALEVVWREHQAIDGLRQLLETEPVQSLQCANCQITIDCLNDKVLHLMRQKTVPLTDEQADLLINGRGDEDDDDYVEPTGDGFGLTDEDLVKLIRRVEEHHGIKKGGA